MRRYALCFLALAVGTPIFAQDNPAAIASKARRVLKTYCYGCHGVEFKVEGLNVLELKTLIAPSSEETPYVTPKNLEKSLLYQRVARNEMPPRNIPKRPGDADKEALRKWIEAGAPAFPETASRKFISTATELEAIRNLLRDANRDDRPYLRFFTLTLAHNDSSVEDADLRLMRAALAKAINSMTWRPIHLPKAIDRDQTIFVIDLRQLDWDRPDLWRAVLREYPYGLRHSADRVERLRKLDEDIADLSGTDVPFIRADWFIAIATRPPLYNEFLQLPDNVAALEQRLGVSVEQNILDGRARRAGFTASGVSEQNRMVERHDSPKGDYYWKSYDFKARTPRNNLFRFPLGPVFQGNPFDRVAFRHAGGEMIFGLPNGMQGYYLAAGDGRRIEEGPTNIVNDPLKTSGTPSIVTGLSCMNCHKIGMFSLPPDAVRTGNAVGGDALQAVERLYPKKDEMDRWIKTDEERFVRSLEKIIGPFMKVGEDAKTPIAEFPEPIGQIARSYLLVDLNAAAVARELGMEKPDELIAAIKANRRLRELGLRPLTEGKTIKREDWDIIIGGTSLFQDVARLLELGEPPVKDLK